MYTSIVQLKELEFVKKSSIWIPSTSGAPGVQGQTFSRLLKSLRHFFKRSKILAHHKRHFDLSLDTSTWLSRTQPVVLSFFCNVVILRLFYQFLKRILQCHGGTHSAMSAYWWRSLNMVLHFFSSSIPSFSTQH